MRNDREVFRHWRGHWRDRLYAYVTGPVRPSEPHHHGLIAMECPDCGCRLALPVFADVNGYGIPCTVAYDHACRVSGARSKARLFTTPQESGGEWIYLCDACPAPRPSRPETWRCPDCDGSHPNLCDDCVAYLHLLMHA